MTAPLTYSLPEAAKRLGAPFTVDWLKSRVKKGEIPYLKLGEGTGRAGRVGFSAAQLAQIVAMFSVTPDPELGDLTPLRRRRSGRGERAAS